MSTLLGNYVTPVPAQQRRGKQWYLGSADAIYQSMNLIVDEQPDIIVVFGADHVYRMDASQMVEAHIESGAAVSVAGHPGAAQGRRPVRRDQDGRRRRHDRRVPGEAGRPAGAGRQPRRVVRVDGQLRLHRRRPRRGARGGRRQRRLPPRHGRRHHPDAGRTRRGRGLRLQAQRRARARPPRDRDYWRDVGTLDVVPRGAPRPGLGRADLQPLQQRVADLHRTTRSCRARSSSSRPSADDAIVCAGSIVSGATVGQSVLGHQRLRRRPAPSSSAAWSWTTSRSDRAPGISNAIIDKNVVVPDGVEIGVDRRGGRARPGSPSPRRASRCSARASPSPVTTPAPAE